MPLKDSDTPFSHNSYAVATQLPHTFQRVSAPGRNQTKFTELARARAQTRHVGLLWVCIQFEATLMWARCGNGVGTMWKMRGYHVGAACVALKN